MKFKYNLGVIELNSIFNSGNLLISVNGDTRMNIKQSLISESSQFSRSHGPMNCDKVKSNSDGLHGPMGTCGGWLDSEWMGSKERIPGGSGAWLEFWRVSRSFDKPKMGRDRENNVIGERETRKKIGKSKRQLNISEARVCGGWWKVRLDHEILFAAGPRMLGLCLQGDGHPHVVVKAGVAWAHLHFRKIPGIRVRNWLVEWLAWWWEDY